MNPPTVALPRALNCVAFKVEAIVNGADPSATPNHFVLMSTFLGVFNCLHFGRDIQASEVAQMLEYGDSMGLLRSPVNIGK